MKLEEFIKVVVIALRMEFEKEVKLETINEEAFRIALDNYEITISVELINKIKSPYWVEKIILKAFESQGFGFDRNRGQYIQYCFGEFNPQRDERSVNIFGAK